MYKQNGVLLIVSGPSGSGKGSICEVIKKRRSDVDLSVSATSRSPRPNDVEGETYYFKTVEQFEKMIQNDELLEWVKYCDNYYGTPLKNIENKLKDGISVILEIEVTGALNVKKRFPDSILVFIIPPSFDDLVVRLRKRGTEDETVIKKRIHRALDEIHLVENYDYLIINDKIDNAVNHIEALIDAEKNKAYRNAEKIKEFINTFRED